MDDRILDLVEMLTEIGCSVSYFENPLVIGSTTSVHFRFDLEHDEVHFAVAKRFDRWANSRDYVFEGIPQDAQEIGIVLKIAEDRAKEGATSGDDFEPLSLNTWWRRYKRDAARNARDVAQVE